MNSPDDEDDSLFGSPPLTVPTWTDPAQEAVRRALSSGVPAEGLAAFARWWQLESWLRLLVYLELRAARGRSWSNGLPRKAVHLAEIDDENAYMPSADSTSLLAYFDFADLLATIGREAVWPLVQPSLVKKTRWDGLADELRSLRNRNAHLRRPHRDDVSRIEQALRDLEPGARRAMEAFNRQELLPGDPRDHVARSWVMGEHEDGVRLIEHARGQYETSFQLLYSERPWIRRQPDTPVSRRRGVLLHARWYMRGDAALRPRDFWEDDYLNVGNTRNLIVLVTHPSPAEVCVTFSAMDSPKQVSDAIGNCFDAVLDARERRPTSAFRKRWLEDAAGLDWRVHVNTPLVEAYYDQPFSVFQA